MEKRKQYSVQTIKIDTKGREFRHEIGVLDVVESAGSVRHYLNLHMFPDTKLSIREKVKNEENNL